MTSKRFLLILCNIVVFSLLLGVFGFVFFFIAAIIAAILEPIAKSDTLDLCFILASFVAALFCSYRIAKKLYSKYAPKESHAQVVSAPLVPAPVTIQEAAPKNLDPEPMLTPATAAKPDHVQAKQPAAPVIRSTVKQSYRDELFPDAVEVTLESRVVSAGRLQSALQIGSIRATKLLEEMEQLGVIGPACGNRSREIFFTLEQWHESKKYDYFWKPEEEKPEPSKQEPVHPKKSNTMYCRYCGKEIAMDSKFCPSCGKQTSESPAIPNAIQQERRPEKRASKRRCYRCGGHNVTHETVVESNSGGCLMVLIYVILALTIFGLLIVIPLMLRSKTKTVTYAVCQDCGNRWPVH